MSAKRRVMIVEDHVAVGDALAIALREWFEVLPLVTALPMLRARMLESHPDAVLLDLAIGSENALEWLPALTRDHPCVRFIVLSAYDEHSLMDGAFRAGARGYLVKSASLQEIRTAVEDVLAGKMCHSSSVHRLPPSRRPTTPPRLPGHDALVQPTPRQQEILELLCAGHTMEATAKALKLHERTIEYHLSALRKKLGGTKRAGVLRWYEEYKAGRQ